jgi:hypothetical protein
MNPNELNRRRFISATAGASAATFLGNAAAQQAQVQRIPPETAGDLHRYGMYEISRALEGTPLNSRSGLHKVVDLLYRLELISKEDAAALDRFIDAVLESKSIDEMQKAIERLRSELASKASEVAAAVASIARDSIDLIKQLARKIAQSEAIRVLVADVSGALTAAVIGRKWGGTAGAVCFAIGGAFYGSAVAAYGTK